MRLRHIEIFEAIRRTGSLTEAAATLHITQPAASKLLANAEMQLGFKLFERVKGRLVATREAEILTPEIARLSQDLNGVRKLAASLRERPHGHLRLGCAPALGLGLLPQVIRASRKTRPGLTFDIQTHHSAELVQGLLTRELDLAVTFDTNDTPGLVREEIGHTELVNVGREPGEGPVTLKQLCGQALIVLDPRDAAGALLQMSLDALELEAPQALQVQTHYVACALAEAGCGEAIVDAITARAMLRPGMRQRPIVPALRVPISVMRRSHDSMSELHRELIAALREACVTSPS
ncbi:MAG: LysR family transcriptional regulator [Bordetella sp.]|uniref:LysR family transcriptional regulator n=1 Tax=Bordetella sp. TaxID=28081 RepID=UPI003F7C42AF